MAGEQKRKTTVTGLIYKVSCDTRRDKRTKSFNCSGLKIAEIVTATNVIKKFLPKIA